jgi:hypothetical protein
MKKKPVHPMQVFTGSKTYTIEHKSLTKDALHGDVDFAKCVIRVDPNQSLEDYKNTLLHEILHIGYDMFGLGSDDDMPTIQNEFLTLVTGNMLRLFANLNPELFEYLFESPK